MVENPGTPQWGSNRGASLKGRPVKKKTWGKRLAKVRGLGGDQRLFDGPKRKKNVVGRGSFVKSKKKTSKGRNCAKKEVVIGTGQGEGRKQ